MSKEILIFTPIGRVKWLKAPADISEVLFHLGKTFKVPEMAVVLKDLQTSAELNETNYQAALDSEADLVWVLSIDEVMKKILEAVPFESDSARPKKEVLEFQQKPESFAQPAETIQRAAQPKRNTREEKTDPLAVTNSRPNRGKVGKTGKTGSEDPRMAEGLQTLKAYGLTNMIECRAALIKANFNVEQAIEYLFP